MKVEVELINSRYEKQLRAVVLKVWGGGTEIWQVVQVHFYFLFLNFAVFDVFDSL